jgi:hypothetical protein
VRRDVRDLDDGGRLLWIGKTKTRAGRRRLLIPDELAPYLVAIAAGRPGDEPLFVSEASGRWPAGRRWSRYMAYNHVRRICTAAKVPTLPPQALRRTQATLATDAGATGLMVAQHLGHATGAAPAVTHRSYVERDAARDAAVQRGLRILQGGRRYGSRRASIRCSVHRDARGSQRTAGAFGLSSDGPPFVSAQRDGARSEPCSDEGEHTEGRDVTEEQVTRLRRRAPEVDEHVAVCTAGDAERSAEQTRVDGIDSATQKTQGRERAPREESHQREAP